MTAIERAKSAGFAVAVLNPFDPSTYIMDPTYGRVYFFMERTWIDDDGIPH